VFYSFIQVREDLQHLLNPEQAEVVEMEAYAVYHTIRLCRVNPLPVIKAVSDIPAADYVPKLVPLDGSAEFLPKRVKRDSSSTDSVPKSDDSITNAHLAACLQAALSEHERLAKKSPETIAAAKLHALTHLKLALDIAKYLVQRAKSQVVKEAAGQNSAKEATADEVPSRHPDQEMLQKWAKEIFDASAGQNRELSNLMQPDDTVPPSPICQDQAIIRQLKDLGISSSAEDENAISSDALTRFILQIENSIKFVEATGLYPFCGDLTYEDMRKKYRDTAARNAANVMCQFLLKNFAGDGSV
jgi:hypothetical protein